MMRSAGTSFEIQGVFVQLTKGAAFGCRADGWIWTGEQWFLNS